MKLKTTRTDKEFLIDDEDVRHLTKVNRSYSVTSHGYVAVIDYIGFIDGRYKYVRQYLHRLVMNAPVHLQVDHINGNKLDNRKANLRLCKNKSNSRNTRKRSGEYKGVHYSKTANKWVAQITKDRKCHHLGVFENAKSAAEAYDRAAKRLHGRYAQLNLTQ